MKQRNKVSRRLIAKRGRPKSGVAAAVSLGTSLCMFSDPDWQWPSLIMASLCGFNLAGGISQHFARRSLRHIERMGEIVEEQGSVIELLQIERCNLAPFNQLDREDVEPHLRLNHILSSIPSRRARRSDAQVVLAEMQTHEPPRTQQMPRAK